MEPDYPEPSLFMLMGFRMGRTMVREKTARDSRDYTYYTEHGWLESDYFYPTRLSPLKKALGSSSPAPGSDPEHDGVASGQGGLKCCIRSSRQW